MLEKKIIDAFPIDGAPISCERFGDGHINETYLLVTDAPHLYILQKINGNVFRDIPGLMRNIAAVTAHLMEKAADPRHVLTLIPTKQGASYLHNDASGAFRLYEYVLNSLCLQSAETMDDFKQSGLAFGTFQTQLADFPADTLTETIPGFHDTPGRYARLHEAIKADPLGRAKGVRAEIDWMLSHEEEAGSMVRMRGEGKLRARVTHNDTKLNNVMLSRAERKPLCVIDLDTVMPGLVANDFGDSIRFGASTAAEDEKDLSCVKLSLPLYTAFAEGFLSACGKSLTALEISTLPLGAKLMTLECGVRFLSDYLSGDTYFRIARPEHNIDRCRTQIQLVRDMETKWDEMGSIVERIGASAILSK